MIENFEWDTHSMAYTGIRLIGFLRHHLGFLGVDGFVVFGRENLIPAIKIRRIQPVKLVGQGYELEFSWPQPEEADLGEVKRFVESEPRFTFRDRSLGELLPSVRSLMFQTIDSVAEEVRDVYKLRLHHTPETLAELIYPKEEYATNKGLEKAVLL